MFKECVGICFTPNTYHSYKNNWSYFNNRQDSYFIIDNTINSNKLIDGFYYTENDIRKNLNFSGNVSKRHFWNSQGNRNIIWFYAHFRMINFYLSNKNYDYYWFFDDDIICNDWDTFFNSFKNDESDFISYFIFKNTNVEIYPTIPKIDGRTYSKGSWFDRFPGHQDNLKNDNKMYFGSFFPIVRYSKRALEELLNQTLEGYTGYGEGFVPTTLSKLDFKMNTIFKPDNTSDYFDVTKVNIIHKNQKINWEWI